MGLVSTILRGSAAACILLALPVASAAQTSGCALQNADGGRRILRCPGGVTVTAEAGAGFNLNDRNGDGSPDSASLRRKAILVDVDSSRHTGGFQVVTPQAIAAVRGTQWAVDVGGGQTSVLVVRGAVAVRRPQGDSVVLRPGEGVDVRAGSSALEVRRWPSARAAALLARLGQ
ncbi:FecR domain-containing protein [Rhizobium sp. SIMBA_035]